VSRILLTGGSGYIGSALHAHLMRAEHEVAIVDRRHGDNLSTSRYQDIHPWQLDRFDVVIHLAAHSSVAACEADPDGAWANNAHDLAMFIAKLTTQTFIFASTGSLYSRNGPRMVYDQTKEAAEASVAVYPNAHILRLATVCGVSPIMREDLILNGMVRDAVKTGVVTVRNSGAWRPVLFLPDLCWFVDRILAGEETPGCHDLASFNARIGSWADIVATATGAVIKEATDTPTYDFRMPILDGAPGQLDRVLAGLKGYWGNKR
jgi:UDP-glucose 4-epimerase